MRPDIMIGLTVSALIHVAVFFGGRLFPSTPVVPPSPQEKRSAIEIMMPKIEEDPPEKIELTNDEVKPIDFAPPMQADTPQVITDISFVQRVQPPLPENVQVSPTMMAIPEHRTPSSLQGIPVFDPKNLDEPPVPRVRTPPQYPFEEKRNGITGDVLVDFIVDPSGKVVNAYALRSSHRGFEQAAVQAVSKWTFKPGRKAGRFVNTHMQVPIVFNLDDTR